MFKVTFYRKPDGTKPAGEFIKGLDAIAKEQVIREIRNLALRGNQLGEPKSKAIKGETNLFELRITERSNNYRLFYFFIVGNEIIITHGSQRNHRKHRARKSNGQSDTGPNTSQANRKPRKGLPKGD